MEHITIFTGEDFNPLDPNINEINIEDIAHALSMICRANGHFIRFYSVAQHCINCANEAKARKLSAKVQLACLLHDASEAYISDITRPVKEKLPEYMKYEKKLQDMIYIKFLDEPLSDEECTLVNKIDDDMLICEFNDLMKKKVFENLPVLKSKPSFEVEDFSVVEKKFRSEMNTNNQNRKKGEDFEIVVKAWFEDEYKKPFGIQVPLDIGNPPKSHYFDIVSDDKSIVVECKCYTWTESGGIPSAKLGFANQATLYLSFLTDSDTYIVMKKSEHSKRTETLAEHYYRKNKHLLGQTKVLEYDVDSKEMRTIE